MLFSGPVRLVLAAALLAQIVEAQVLAGAAQPAEERVQASFVRGVVAIEAGDAQTAVRIFRDLLAEDPNLHRVRLELARAYFVLQEWELSRREFLTVLSANIPYSVKRNIIRFLDAIDRRRGWDWSLDIALAGNPLASRNFTSDTVTVNFLGIPLDFEIEEEDEPSIGVRVRGDLEFRKEIKYAPEHSVALGSYFSIFADATDYETSSSDDFIGGASMGIQLAFPQARVNAGPTWFTRHFGGELYENRFTLEAVGEYRTLGGLSLFGGMSGGYVDNIETDLRDGGIASMRFGAVRSFGGATLVRGSVSFSRFRAEADFESFKSARLELSTSADLGRGFVPTLSTRVEVTGFDESAPLFFEKRQEIELAVDLKLVKADWFLGMFNPYIALGATRNFSDIAIYDFYEYRVEAGVTRAF